MEASRILFLLGALPYLVLGTLHAWHTPVGDGRRGLDADDPALQEAMGRSGLRLTRRTDMWRAWIGFNYSHSLGVLLLGLLAVLVARSSASFALDGPVFLPLAVLASAAYLVLGLRYWFRIPIAGCAFGFACFLAAWLLQLTSP